MGVNHFHVTVKIPVPRMIWYQVVFPYKTGQLREKWMPDLTKIKELILPILYR